jgi:hypothetical protein
MKQDNSKKDFLQNNIDLLKLIFRNLFLVCAFILLLDWFDVIYLAFYVKPTFVIGLFYTSFFVWISVVLYLYKDKSKFIWFFRSFNHNSIKSFLIKLNLIKDKRKLSSEIKSDYKTKDKIKKKSRKKKKELKLNFSDYINTIFQYVLVAYLILLLIEEVWPNSISVYLNLNYLLFITIVFGVLSAFSSPRPEEKKPVTKKDYFFVIVLAVVGFVLIKYKTGELGGLSWVISIISGFLIFLVSLLILEEDEDNEKEAQEDDFKLDLNLKKLSLFLIFISLVIVIALSFTKLSVLESARIVYGSFFVLFLPGFIISHIFFKKDEIDTLERIALSFALSIAIIPLFVFYTNLLGIKINTLNVSLQIIFICIVSGLIIYIREKKPNLLNFKK